MKRSWLQQVIVSVWMLLVMAEFLSLVILPKLQGRL